MVNTAELRQIFPLRENTLRHVVEGDGRYPRAMTPSAIGNEKEWWTSHYGVAYELNSNSNLSRLSDWSVHSRSYFFPFDWDICGEYRQPIAQVGGA